MDQLSDKMPDIGDLRRSYDEVPYPDLPKPYTHISRLAAIGRLHGLTPPNPDNCNVLELGCADGGNILTMASQFPESRFIGVDFAAVQIETGRKKISELEQTNLSLQRANIIDFRPDDHRCFDYIIVHGVYSWVSSIVQEKILSICRNHLSGNGLAYISYNTYPGWRGKQALREMLRYHTRHIDETQKKVEAALALVATLPTPQEIPGDPGALLAQQLQNDLKQMEDPSAYLVHEYLIDRNEPLYFSEFLRRIEGFTLKYVDDAFPGCTALERLLPNAQSWMAKTYTDYAEQQQYIDFLCNISFRRSLLCQATAHPNNKVNFNRFRSLYVTATCKHAESDGDKLCFVTDSGRRLHTEHSELGMILKRIVNARPASLAVENLRKDIGRSVTDKEIAVMLDTLLRNSASEFTTHPHDCNPNIGERPYAPRLVRFQCSSGLVTSGAHRPVRLENVFERQLLGMLDGTRRLPELISSMQKKLRCGNPIDDTEWEVLVLKHLARLAQLGLLKDRDRV